MGTKRSIVFIWRKKPLIEELASGLRHGPVGRVHKFVHMLAVFVRKNIAMMLQDGDDQPHGLHRHIVLPVQSHRNNSVFEFGGEKFQLALQFF